MWGVCVYVLSRVQLFDTPGTVAHQAPLSMGSSGPQYWTGLPFPSPGLLPNPGIEPVSLASPALQADSLTLYHLGSPYYVDLYLKKQKSMQAYSQKPWVQTPTLSHGEANGASGWGVRNATQLPGFRVPLHTGYSITSGLCRVGEVAG